ncbi:unnamed protein product [Phytophthora fragariaefolia]|uniref:Unnamed protein product n=1 Tax=Phytophthora fragariaefolia TaxID=1490495 RepID=A0A9W6TWX7_9STRA|nr:unnamed protein product [Phytophthora fragariaefolia]
MRRLQVADDASEDLKLERTQDAGTVDAKGDGLEVKALLLDSGADTSMVARGVIDALQVDGVLVHLRRVADQELKPVGSGQLTKWELAGVDATTAHTAEGTTPIQRVCRLQAAAMDTSVPSVADVERYETRTEFPTMAPELLAHLIRTLEQRFKVATEMGLVLEPRARLKAILTNRQDVFQLQFGDDPPVRVAPLQVRLKPGVTLTKSQPQRCASLLCARLVRGYWQLSLHPDSQEYFTFVTHRGMYTPTRVPMGATDAVAYCQGVVEEIFGDLLGNGILCWLDDILGYAADTTALMELLDKGLARCEEYGLKLHAKKCRFFATEVKWCGKLISAQGVRHCPERVDGLIDTPLPRTAGELQ